MSKETVIAQAEEAMQIAYIDWQDNCSSEYFRDKFFIAQERYKKLTRKQK